MGTLKKISYFVSKARYVQDSTLGRFASRPGESNHAPPNTRDSPARSYIPRNTTHAHPEEPNIAPSEVTQNPIPTAPDIPQPVDSEPEREERRMAEIKKHGKQAKRPRQKPTAIIEVSSDESDPHPAGQSQRDSTNRVDVLGGYFPHKKLVSPLQNLFR